MKFRRVGFQTRQTSPLGRKGRGSHPVLGLDLKQRGQRENLGMGLRPVHSQQMQFVRKQSFTRSYIIFRRSIG